MEMRSVVKIGPNLSPFSSNEKEGMMKLRAAITKTTGRIAKHASLILARNSFPIIPSFLIIKIKI
jgi:hypothetical protein